MQESEVAIFGLCGAADGKIRPDNCFPGKPSFITRRVAF